MSFYDEMELRNRLRNEPRTTTRESTMLYSQARRALREGNPSAAHEIGKEAAKVAVKEVRNPIRTDDEAKSLFRAKQVAKLQAGYDIAQKMREANQYTAAGYVKPTEGLDTQLGKRQHFYNEMVANARSGTLDTAEAQAQADRRGLNLTPAEFAAGLSRIATSTGTSPTSTGTSPTGTGTATASTGTHTWLDGISSDLQSGTSPTGTKTATASNTSTLNPVAGITPPVKGKKPQSPTGMLAANDEMKKLRSKTTSMLTTPMLTA